ncbi:MAG: DUF448 domain-containing protein [Desulfovibrionaceae bacterium]|nr:DUF448 domain-containing protein [Desulfovibrionaceae bacterium]
MAGSSRTGPERMCVICRRRFPKRELTRYTLSSQGVLTRDENKNSPGRGWYVCSDARCARNFSTFRAGVQRRRG